MHKYKEKAFTAITYTASLFTIMVLFALIYGLFREGLPLFNKVSLTEFILAVAGIQRMQNRNSVPGLLLSVLFVLPLEL